ncbi:MAG: AEC family transporter [Kiritimatiellae bacterium]|nr:AEC family transporter [Kiritimatiellia bacterium]
MNAALAVPGVLFPVFFMLALGAALRRTGFFREEAAKGLNRLVFHGALPCMLVDSISTAAVADRSARTSLALALATLATAAAGWVLAKPLGIPRASRGTFCQTVLRSNNAYIGIPVMASAFAVRPDLAAEGMPLAVMTLAPCLLLYNLLGVAFLTRPGDGDSIRVRAWRVASGIARNPLILACLAGLALLYAREKWGFALPMPIARTVSCFGGMATAGSLLALGASLTPERVKAARGGAFAAAFVKLAVCPLVGLATCAALGLGGLHMFVVLAFLACPSAVASYVMAEEMGGDARLAGAAVALTTVLSSISLGLVLLFALP